MVLDERLKNKRHQYLRMKPVLLLLMAALAVLLVIATAVGTVGVPFFQTVKIILKNVGILKDVEFPQGWEQIIFFVRFPRVITACLVGAGLAASGTVMQGMFRNPMADPGILGVSSGAGLGAVTAIALGLTARSIYVMPLFASAGALFASFTIYVLASRDGKTPIVNLVLSGMAVSMFLGSIITIVLTYIHGDQVKQFLFWTTGSLNGRRWEDAAISAGPIVIGIAILMFYTRDMNVLLMGEEEAQTVGMDTIRVRKMLLIVSSVITATAVCVSGSISFVGLIVPHIMRLILGPDHRVLLPSSVIGGAIFLVLCDLLGRTVSTREISVGIITALIGAPYFLFLLNRARKDGGIF